MRRAAKRTRVADSVETTLKLGSGIILVSIIGGEERLYSEHFACVYCGISIEEVEPRSFSFNSPKGACPECNRSGHQAGDRRRPARYQPRPEPE